jgi:arabinose-5-phosphate isomerase
MTKNEINFFMDSVLDVEAQAILALKNQVKESFPLAIDLLKSLKGKLICTGVGKSGFIARKIASTFSSVGVPSFFIHPTEGSHGDFGAVSETDIVLAISYGGESVEMAPMIKFLNRKNIPIIAMTAKTDSSLAKNSKVVLDVQVKKEACPLELAPTASSTACLALGDAIAMSLMKFNKVTSEQFAELHPSGSLGQRLMRISEVMHTGAGFISATTQTSLKEIISQMSRAETRGACAVLDDKGNLAGVITDGDIRRRLERVENPLNGVAQDLMTTNPRTIDCNEYTEKALFYMEQFKIHVLLVLNKTSSEPLKPVGILHIQDLLRNRIK